MTFIPESLSTIVQPIGGVGLRFFSYRTDDTVSEVTGSGYFTNAVEFGVRFADLVFVIPISGAVESYVTVVSDIDVAGDVTVSLSVGIGGPVAATREALATNAKAGVVTLTETWREGQFKWVEGDLSAQVAADPMQGVYVAAADDSDGSDGAWVRMYDGVLRAQWFGAYPAALDTAAASVPDRAAEVQAALDFAAFQGGGIVEMPVGKIAIATTLTIGDFTEWRGVGSDLSIVIEAAPLAGPVAINKNVSMTSGALGAPGIVVSHLGFDGSLRTVPLWLSKLDGTPITDPEADYLPGGILSAPTPATISITLSGGAIVSASILTPGTGYVYEPTVWLTGDGRGGKIDCFISGGQVTTLVISDEGQDYTTISSQVVGGGANPKPTLVNANRRNPNYSAGNGVFNFSKASAPTIEDCKFLNHYAGTCVTNGGCDRMIVRRNLFRNGGQPDFVGNCLWSQSHGSITSPPAYFRRSTNTVFEQNIVENWERSVALCGGIDEHFRNNSVNGWGESCWFITPDARNFSIYDNQCKGGRITDIVCFFVEGSRDGLVFNNAVEDCDGCCVQIDTGGGMRVIGNRFSAPAPADRTLKVPFGPYSERHGAFNGQPAVAGTYRGLATLSAVNVGAGSIAANSPKATTIAYNRAVHDVGEFEKFVSFTKGAAHSIGDILVEGNDLSLAPGLPLYDEANAEACLDPARQFIRVNNLGMEIVEPVYPRTISSEELMMSTAGNLVPNPSFSILHGKHDGDYFTDQSVHSWGDALPSSFSVVARGGSAPQSTCPTPYMLKVGNHTAAQNIYSSENYAECRPGEIFYISAMIAYDTAPDGNLRLTVSQAQIDGSVIFQFVTVGAGSLSTAWTKIGGHITAQPNTCGVRMRIYKFAGGSGGNYYITNCELTRYVTCSGASVTGSRGGNAALASLLTQLAATGIIVDTSTA